MNVHRTSAEFSSNGDVLYWNSRVVSAEALRRSLRGHREILVPARAVITPLAQEELRSRGVRVVSRLAEAQSNSGKTVRWGVGQDRQQPLVRTAVQALQREGIELQPLPQGQEPAEWARAVAECVARGACCGGVVFCRDPGLVCCVANKLPGLRAVAVSTVTQAAQAALSVGANLLAVEMPGRTYFEVRQILRLCCAGAPCFPAGLAAFLRELEHHACR